MLLPQIRSKNYDFWKLRSKSSKSFIRFKISYVIHMPFACHLYVTRMYSHAFCISLVCTHMPSVCHSYVFVCHSYVTRMQPYVIRMSLVYTRMLSYVIRMSLVCTRMSSLCHSHVLVCYPYITRMYSYVTCMSLVCSFIMNPENVAIVIHEIFTLELYFGTFQFCISIVLLLWR